MPDTRRKPKWFASLYSRAFLFTAIGCGCLFGALFIQSHYFLNQSVDRILEERTGLAQTAGKYIENMIYHDLKEVEKAVLLSKNSKIPLHETLMAVYNQTLFKEGLFYVDLNHNLIGSFPSKNIKLLFSNNGYTTLFKEAENSQNVIISKLVPSPNNKRQEILLIKYIADLGYIGGVFFPGTFNLLQPFKELETGASMHLVNASGVIVASSNQKDLFQIIDHENLLTKAIQDNKILKGRCHSCHTEDPNSPLTRQKEILAFAPLSTLPLGLAIKQPEKEALAPAFRLQLNLLMVGLAFIILFLFFTGLSVHSVVSPIKRITNAVMNVENDFSQSVPVFGKDELGQLSRALNRWRKRIIDSIETKRRHKESQEFLQRVLHTQEDERKRVARDLHDSLAQELAAHKLSIERLQDPSIPLNSELEQLEENANLMLLSLRKIILDLRPSILEEMGFHHAVQWYLERVEKEENLKTSLTINSDTKELTENAQMAIFRIFQEALNNSINHAKASHIHVTIAYLKHFFELIIKDDGIGFNTHDIPHTDKTSGRGLGILGMKERTELMCGTFEIESKEGEGTTIYLQIPYHCEEQERCHEVTNCHCR